MNLHEMPRHALETAYVEAMNTTFRLQQNENELYARLNVALEAVREAQKCAMMATKKADYALDAARHAEAELMLVGVAVNLITGRKA